MNIKNFGIIVEKFVKENAPTILMSAGLGLFGGAIYETGKATVKSVRQVDTIEGAQGDLMTPKEIVKECWKNYIPAAGLTLGGTACIIGANHMNLKRIEALATAYALNKDKFKEYQDKVKEVLGEQKEYDIRDKIAQDHTDAQDDNPPWMPCNELIENLASENLVTVRCGLTGKLFKSSSVLIDKAVNEFNSYLMEDHRESLSLFYDILGELDCGKAGDDYFWDISNGRGGMMKVDPHYTRGKNGEPIMELEFLNFRRKGDDWSNI